MARVGPQGHGKEKAHTYSTLCGVFMSVSAVRICLLRVTFS